VGNNTQKTILLNVLTHAYSVGRSQLQYAKKKWFLYLTYAFEAPQRELIPDKICNSRKRAG